MEQALEKLQNSLSRKHFIPIKAEFFDSEFTMEFENRLELKQDVDYQIGLLWFQGTNSIFNIHSNNNNFRYYNGTVWKQSTIRLGGVDHEKINTRIKEVLKENNDNEEAINITAETSSLQSIIKLSNNYQIDFSIPNSFGNLLGFNNIKITKQGINYSTNIVELASVGSIDIGCNIVKGFYVNGKSTNILHSFAIPAPLGYTFEVKPQNVIWLPISTRNIDSITFSILNKGNKIKYGVKYQIQLVVIIKQV